MFYRQLLELCLLHPKVPVGVDFLATEILQRQYQKCKKVVNSKQPYGSQIRYKVVFLDLIFFNWKELTICA